MNASNIKAGTIATVKVGRNEVTVEVTAVTEHGWMVRSQSSGKEFEAKKLARIICEPESPVEKPEKKLSLLDAAFEVLKGSEFPLSPKEMVAQAIEAGLWIPTAAKTPEQSLYSAIFREIGGKEFPRFSKSATCKGAFVAIK